MFVGERRKLAPSPLFRLGFFLRRHIHVHSSHTIHLLDQVGKVLHPSHPLQYLVKYGLCSQLSTDSHSHLRAHCTCQILNIPLFFSGMHSAKIKSTSPHNFELVRNALELFECLKNFPHDPLVNSRTNGYSVQPLRLSVEDFQITIQLFVLESKGDNQSDATEPTILMCHRHAVHDSHKALYPCLRLLFSAFAHQILEAGYHPHDFTKRS